MRILDRLRGVSIGVRLAVLMAGLLLVSIGGFATIGLVSQRDRAFASAEWDARRLIESLESTLRVQMLHGDARLGVAIADIARPEGVEAALLVDRRATVKYATDPMMIDIALAAHDYPCSHCHENGFADARPGSSVRGSVAFVSADRMKTSGVVHVVNGPECTNAACHHHDPAASVLGVLQIDIPNRDLVASLTRHRNQMLIVIAVIVVTTTLLVLYLVRRWVGRPVAELRRGTQLVARGDTSQHISVGEGELGALAAAFNRMQEKLASSRRQVVMAEKLATVGKLAAGVAHEINNPLTGVLAFAEDLELEATQDDPKREDYAVIRREAMRCREIVRNLLDFSRQEQPSLKVLQPGPVLDHMVRLVEKLATFQNIRIETNLEKDLPRILGDAGQLQQVFLNLLINAAEAMPGGGTLTIRGYFVPSEQMVRIAFSDTGPGISDEHRSKIFEPFFSTKAGKTSGLGLAISWGIVEQHGGQLVLAKTGETGTTFCVVLPAARSMEPRLGANAEPG